MQSNALSPALCDQIYTISAALGEQKMNLLSFSLLQRDLIQDRIQKP